MSILPVEYKWRDCGCMFVCPVCGEECYADSENEERNCPNECGMRYSMTYTLTVITPPASAAATDGG